MARKPRIHYPGAIYHVIVKGNNGEAIFFDDLCKNKYLSLLVRYKRELGFILFAFCIMTNHAHLLVAVQEVPLSQIMQRVQLVFTQWFNRTFNRTGHVFQQRYKALLCNSEIYFFELIRYIHNNPVKENLPGGFKYKWSSYSYYIGIERGNLVDITDTLEKFSKDRTEALRRYLHFMDQEQYPGDPENSEGIDMGADPRESTNLESLGENVNIENETGKHGGGFSHRFSGDGNGTNKGERRNFARSPKRILIKKTSKLPCFPDGTKVWKFELRLMNNQYGGVLIDQVICSRNGRWGTLTRHVTTRLVPSRTWLIAAG